VGSIRLTTLPRNRRYRGVYHLQKQLPHFSKLQTLYKLHLLEVLISNSVKMATNLPLLAIKTAWSLLKVEYRHIHSTGQLRTLPRRQFKSFQKENMASTPMTTARERWKIMQHSSDPNKLWRCRRCTSLSKLIKISTVEMMRQVITPNLLLAASLRCLSFLKLTQIRLNQTLTISSNRSTWAPTCQLLITERLSLKQAEEDQWVLLWPQLTSMDKPSRQASHSTNQARVSLTTPTWIWREWQAHQTLRWPVAPSITPPWPRRRSKSRTNRRSYRDSYTRSSVMLQAARRRPSKSPIATTQRKKIEKMQPSIIQRRQNKHTCCLWINHKTWKIWVT